MNTIMKLSAAAVVIVSLSGCGTIGVSHYTQPGYFNKPIFEHNPPPTVISTPPTVISTPPTLISTPSTTTTTVTPISPTPCAM
jgi:hypothetical protein